MPTINQEKGNWFESAEYLSFRKNLLRKPGAHLLGLGMTGSGKTMKALMLAKWCLQEGKAVVWFDTAKPEDMKYLLHFAKRVNIFYPKGEPRLEITGSDADITYHVIENPAHLFRNIQPGLNIVSIRPFFTDLPPYVKYLARVINGLINDSYRENITTTPIQIFMDEFQEICPAKRIHHTHEQQLLGARVSMGILRLRSIGVGFCAFTQSYRNIMPAVRLQFSYYLICQNPDGDLNDHIGKKLLTFAPQFSDLAVDQCYLMTSRARFSDSEIHWPMPVMDKLKVRYSGFFFREEEGEAGAPQSARLPGETVNQIKGTGMKVSEFIKAAVREKLGSINPRQEYTGPLAPHPSVSQDHGSPGQSLSESHPANSASHS